MPVTKKKVLEDLTAAEKAVRRRETNVALHEIEQAKAGVAQLREPAPPVPAPTPEPPPAPQPTPPPPAPAPTYPPAAPNIGAFRTIYDFPERLLASSSRAQMVPDPAGSDRSVISLTCLNGDTGNPTPNPRAQLGTAYILKPESTYWGRTRIFFPKDFPTFRTWMTLVSIWAPPYGGDGAPFHFMSWNGTNLEVERNSNSHDDTPLAMPITRGQWMDLLWCERLSKTDGFVEVWVDGKQQTFENGQARLAYPTIDNTNSGGNQNLRLEVYYAHNGIPNGQPVTVLFDGLYVGTSRESVGA
ncbi:MAG TPA: heparin lyase I family protein [Solirubrobacterales bacterium]|nr:heparin lyase I family protein [Solirubrobacterales bacterium]